MRASVTCDVDQAALDRLRSELPEVPAIPADVADEAAVDRLFELALEQLGGLDILINNAGIAGPTGPIEEITPEDWRRTLEVNITGQYLCARRAVPHIRAAGGGSIVNLSSAAGRFGFALRIALCASKWAVVGLTKSARDRARRRSDPGQRDLPRCGRGRSHRPRDRRQGRSARHHRSRRCAQQYVETASMRRMISPQDIANMILFLCSDAGRLVSGQVIGVDGNVEYLR